MTPEKEKNTEYTKTNQVIGIKLVGDNKIEKAR